MKRKLIFAAIATAVVCVCVFMLSPIKVSAKTDGYYTYTVSGGEATITDCDTAFSGDMTIPSTLGGYPVTSIGNRTFFNCSNITSIIIGNDITSIGGWAFAYCSGLTSINVSEENTAYKSIDGVLYSKDETKLIACPGGKTVIDIPDSVNIIEDCSFVGCTSLTSITIPDGVTSIGFCAFIDCSGLISITIPNSVTNIGMLAFSKCSSLTSITIPNNLTSIDGYTFDGCTALASITIPDSVTSIGSYAFYECSSLTEIYFEGTKPTIDEYAFFSVTANVYGLSGKGWETIDNYGGTLTLIILYTVTFKNYDGSVVQSDTYRYGDVVNEPLTTPTKPDYEKKIRIYIRRLG